MDECIEELVALSSTDDLKIIAIATIK